MAFFIVFILLIFSDILYSGKFKTNSQYYQKIRQALTKPYHKEIEVFIQRHIYRRIELKEGKLLFN